MKWLPIREMSKEYQSGMPYRVLRADGYKEIVRFSDSLNYWSRIDGSETYQHVSLHPWFDYFCPDVVVPDEVKHGLGEGWISVHEKMPNDGEDVLILVKNQHGRFIVDTSECYLDKKIPFEALEFYDNASISHWMPFPGVPDMGDLI